MGSAGASAVSERVHDPLGAYTQVRPIAIAIFATLASDPLCTRSNTDGIRPAIGAYLYAHSIGSMAAIVTRCSSTDACGVLPVSGVGIAGGSLPPVLVDQSRMGVLHAGVNVGHHDSLACGLGPHLVRPNLRDVPSYGKSSGSPRNAKRWNRIDFFGNNGDYVGSLRERARQIQGASGDKYLVFNPKGGEWHAAALQIPTKSSLARSGRALQSLYYKSSTSAPIRDSVSSLQLGLRTQDYKERRRGSFIFRQRFHQLAVNLVVRVSGC